MLTQTPPISKSRPTGCLFSAIVVVWHRSTPNDMDPITQAVYSIFQIDGMVQICSGDCWLFCEGSDTRSIKLPRLDIVDSRVYLEVYLELSQLNRRGLLP